MGIGTPELCGLINADGGSPLKVSLILIYADLFSDSVSPHLHCIPWNRTLPKHIESSSRCATVDFKGSITSSDGHCGDPPVGLDALGCIKPKSKIFYNLSFWVSCFLSHFICTSSFCLDAVITHQISSCMGGYLLLRTYL